MLHKVVYLQYNLLVVTSHNIPYVNFRCINNDVLGPLIGPFFCNKVKQKNV